MGAYQYTASGITGTSGFLDAIRTFLEAQGWTIDAHTAGTSLDVSRSIGGVTCRFSIVRSSTTILQLNGYTGAGRTGGRGTPVNLQWSGSGPASGGVIYSSSNLVFLMAIDTGGNWCSGGFGRMATFDAALGGDVTGVFVFGGETGNASGWSASSGSRGMIRINNAGVASWLDVYDSTLDVVSDSQSHLAEWLSLYPNISGFRPLLLAEYFDPTALRNIGYVADDLRVIPWAGVTHLSQEAIGADTWLRVWLGGSTSLYGAVGLALKL